MEHIITISSWRCTAALNKLRTKKIPHTTYISHTQVRACAHTYVDDFSIHPCILAPIHETHLSSCQNNTQTISASLSLCLPLPLSLRISFALPYSISLSLSLSHIFSMRSPSPALPPPHPHFQRCHPPTPNFNVDGVRVPCAALKHPCTIPSPTPHPCRTTLKLGVRGAGHVLG